MTDTPWSSAVQQQRQALRLPKSRTVPRHRSDRADQPLLPHQGHRGTDLDPHASATSTLLAPIRLAAFEKNPLGIPNILFPFVSQVAVGRRPQLLVFVSSST